LVAEVVITDEGRCFREHVPVFVVYQRPPPPPAVAAVESVSLPLVGGVGLLAGLLLLE